MKFKKMVGISLVSLLLVLTMSSVALAAEKSAKLDLKMKQIEEMESKGINNQIEKDIAEYYKNNNVIVGSNINDLDSPEARKLIKMIEQDMDKFDAKLKLKANKNYSGNMGTMSFGDDPPTGSNSINYNAFEDADIILVHDGIVPYGYYRHGGTYDQDEEEFVSAQLNDVGNGKGVIWEDQDFYRDNYDRAIGLWVPDDEDEERYETRDSIMQYLRAQLGEPYKLSLFNTRDSWYCTKLPWVGWEEFYDTNINRGFVLGASFCLPDDILFDNDTEVFVSSD